MAITTVSSREFNQDVSKSKRATLSGPVFITDRGRTAHVLLTIDDYHAITGNKQSIVDLLAMPEVAEIDFEADKLDNHLFQPADLS
jgi:PHD/YefM family antitoxin component YafN of YafNO toxin-antitoxin module